MKTCSRCGAENVDDAAFCANCGGGFEPSGSPAGEFAPGKPQPPYSQSPAGPYTQPPPGYPYQAPVPGAPYQAPVPGAPYQAPVPGAPYQPYPPYGPMVRTSNSKATASLILGIIGILIFPIICSVLAIILGSLAKKEIEAYRGWQTGESNATAGIILGIVGLVIWVVGIIVFNII